MALDQYDWGSFAASSNHILNRKESSVETSSGMVADVKATDAFMGRHTKTLLQLRYDEDPWHYFAAAQERDAIGTMSDLQGLMKNINGAHFDRNRFLDQTTRLNNLYQSMQQYQARQNMQGKDDRDDSRSELLLRIEKMLQFANKHAVRLNPKFNPPRPS